MGSGNSELDRVIAEIAGDMASITADNVADIIEKANGSGKAIEMADYITGNRPDLGDEVEEAVGDALARF